MKTEKVKVDIVFRRYPAGDIIALMPHVVETHEGNVMCYQHVGQHGSADYFSVILSTEPARPEEYADLKRELESIGYIVNPVIRINRKKYIQSLTKSRR